MKTLTLAFATLLAMPLLAQGDEALLAGMSASADPRFKGATMAMHSTVGFGLSGYVPALEGMPHYDSEGYGGAHLYMPWWMWDKHDQLDFPRGYHIEIGGGYGMPGVGSFHGAARTYGYGKKMKEEIRREYGCRVGFAGRGEMIPNQNSYCEIDKNVVDQWGIPVLRFHWKWSDHEIKQAEHMQQTERQWTLEVWQLEGEPSTWGAQLAARQAARPAPQQFGRRFHVVPPHKPLGDPA